MLHRALRSCLAAVGIAATIASCADTPTAPPSVPHRVALYCGPTDIYDPITGEPCVPVDPDDVILDVPAEIEEADYGGGIREVELPGGIALERAEGGRVTATNLGGGYWRVAVEGPFADSDWSVDVYAGTGAAAPAGAARLSRIGADTCKVPHAGLPHAVSPVYSLRCWVYFAGMVGAGLKLIGRARAGKLRGEPESAGAEALAFVAALSLWLSECDRGVRCSYYAAGKGACTRDPWPR